VRGLRPEGANLWPASGEEEAVVCWLREGAPGGVRSCYQEVRGLRAKEAKLWAVGRGEGTLVPRLCGGAHGAMNVVNKKCEQKEPQAAEVNPPRTSSDP
jgi:hypothetical protein